MRRDYHVWLSPALDREMEILIFGEGGQRVLVFPTRKGRFFEFEDGGLVDSLRTHLESGWIQLICVDSVDAESVYNFDIAPEARLRRHQEYEKYILEEVLPFSEKLNPNSTLASLGCSLGAYHAMNVALRHPHHFAKVLALSGRFDLTLHVPDFQDLFSGYYNEDVYYHQPTHYLPNLEDPAILQHIQKLDITMVVGMQDPFFGNNELLSKQLWAKGVWHRFRHWPGRAHRWERWREMLPVFL